MAAPQHILTGTVKYRETESDVAHLLFVKELCKTSLLVLRYVVLCAKSTFGFCAQTQAGDLASTYHREASCGVERKHGAGRVTSGPTFRKTVKMAETPAGKPRSRKASNLFLSGHVPCSAKGSKRRGAPSDHQLGLQLPEDITICTSLGCVLTFMRVKPAEIN